MKKLALLFLALTLLSACSVPDRKVVQADFLKAYPTATLTEFYVGEGDSDAAYYHFKYRLPGDTADREDVWLYMKEESGWQLRSKEIGRAQ
jgi:hypothetical protein